MAPVTQIAAAGLDRTQWDVQNAQRELIKVKETFYLLFLEDKRAQSKRSPWRSAWRILPTNATALAIAPAGGQSRPC